MTHARLTVTASGQASGTVQEPVAGTARMAWSGGQLYVNGDTGFWAQQDPLYGTDLTSAGLWVAPKRRSGHFMLDSLGVNAGSLSPTSLAALIRQVTADPGAVQEDAGTIEGQRATSYTARGWTVILASSSPYTVLAIGGEPHGDGPIKSASWRAPRHPTGDVASAEYRAGSGPADDPDNHYNPYLVIVPKPATEEQTAAARTAATEAAAAAVPPASSGGSDSKPQGPDFTITSNNAYLCTADPCAYSFTVTNNGDEPGEATLYLSFPDMPDEPHPLGTLEPGQSQEVDGTRPDIAGAGQTVQHTGHAWIYSPAVYGPDTEAAGRLHARRLEPDDVPVATPLKPTVAKLLDLMTNNAPASDTEANDKAVEALVGANGRGQLPSLAAIAASGRLENPQDLSEVVPTTAQLGGQRVMEQIAYLLKTDPNAKVTWNEPYKVKGETYKADYIYTSTRNGQNIKRAVQVKTVNSLKDLGALTGHGAQQLNGESPGPGNSRGEEAPPGFERVLQINVEPSVGPLFYLASTAGLEKFLSTGRKLQQARENLCKPDGDPRVDRLVIVNESGTHQWTDLSRLGVHC